MSFAVAVLVASVAFVTGAPPPPVNPALQKLIEKYGAIRNETCASVLSHVPTLDAADSAAFMSEYQKYTGNNSEAAVLAAAQKLVSADSTLDKFLSLPDSISPGGLDAAMVKCAVMVGAATAVGGSPKSQTSEKNLLAQFAVLGATQEALVDKLLDTPSLMRDMLVAGGAAGGHYGEAMSIWTDLLNASSELVSATSSASDLPWDDHSPENILKRLALGTAVGLAMPMAHRNAKNMPNNSLYVDPVARYLHYEAHYKSGDLDPAFPVLTSFELAHTIDADAYDFEFTWLRKTLGNFRPDLIAMTYHWRYAESVHTEVAYGDSHCPEFPGVCQGFYSDIPVGGDVCGGRAFWGRFSRKGFGIPTWGATEHAHAAMSSWTPTGWNVLLGAPWPDCWWGARGGEDFYLETRARDNQTEFQKVLRGEWAGLARGDAPVSLRWSSAGYTPNNGQGGLFPALMLYKKKLIEAESPAPNRTIPPAQPGIVNKIDALLARWAQPPAPPVPPHTAPDGTITVTAAAYTSKNHSAPVNVIKSFVDGVQLVSNGCSSSVGPPCFHPASSSVTYNVTADKAGTHFLTANFSTYHMNQDLFVSVNGASSQSLQLFYTLGWWNETQPVAVQLVQGANTLTFTRTSGRDVSFKEFVLATTKPNVPQPNGNFTPVPQPPSPPPGSYIEVPADTNCVKQGIQPVSEKDCSHACLALGFKSTGPRARPNISGCFVMASGQWEGNCNFNTNTSASCVPPCTLFGAEVRSLCVRQ
eukprot:m.1638057 g.1638057  ORF g.1638057 m.1638057 type:complete len:755 (-) comp26715_c0_seq1:263-2527(-)